MVLASFFRTLILTPSHLPYGIQAQIHSLIYVANSVIEVRNYTWLELRSHTVQNCYACSKNKLVKQQIKLRCNLVNLLELETGFVQKMKKLVKITLILPLWRDAIDES
jgi:hypothetical protein